MAVMGLLVTSRLGIWGTAFVIAVAMPMGTAVASQNAAAHLRELAKPGLIDGFDLGGPLRFRTAHAVRTASGVRPPKPEIERLEREGLLEAASIRMRGRSEQAARGAISVLEFKDPAGAKAEMAVERKDELGIEVPPRSSGRLAFVRRRFPIPGVSSAVGFMALPTQWAKNRDYHAGVAKGIYVDERCLFSVGIFRPGSEDVVKPVVRVIQIISGRADEACS